MVTWNEAAGGAAQGLPMLVKDPDGRPRLLLPQSVPIWADPRPDLTEDHARWLVLLERAYQVDHEAPRGVYGALHGLRCCGAHLAVQRGGAGKLERGEMGEAEWAGLRAEWLMPHLARIKELLAAA